MAAQAGGHLVGEHGNAGGDLLPALEIFRKGQPVAHRLWGRVLSRRSHRSPVQAVGVVVELGSRPPQQLIEGLPVKPGQFPDGAHPKLLQRAPRRPAHKQ